MPGKKRAAHLTISRLRNDALAASLRRHRKGSEMSFEALGHASGVHPRHIARIERGAANPTLATIYALADALHLRVSDLLPD